MPLAGLIRIAFDWAKVVAGCLRASPAACRRAWCVALLSVALPARARQVESPYRDVIEWGRLQALTAAWHGDELRLTNRWASVSFHPDSPRALVDGVELRLCDSIIMRGGRLLVTQRDIEKSLNPLLTPPQRSGRPIRTVAINAGHGGKDPGNMVGRREEKNFTLALAKEVKRQMENAGVRVIMVRASDSFVELDDRASIANRASADLYLSLHFNETGDTGAGRVQGVETYCLTPAGASSSNDTDRHGGPRFPSNNLDRLNIVFAQMVHRSVLQETDLLDRGVRRARFKELTLLRMPGILLEGGYMNHPHDGRYLYDGAGRSKLATAIVDGVLAYKRLLERG
jgi:N-acetylmuramoyl-L-alanine amidase